ncbi:MAG: hypothetical protein ACRCZF_04340 [Gemmataceae bacterium]
MARRRLIGNCLGFGLGLGTTGCASLPPLDNPVLLRGGATENPILVAPGEPTANTYAEVYEQILDVLDNYFEMKPTSRYAGHIETLPRLSPGYEQPWKVGSPDARERLISTFQTMRHIAVVDIWAGERGGYRVSIEVYKELEDLSRPSQAIAGGSLFREAPTVERRAEIIGSESTPERFWIPKGRDYAFEQKLLKELADKGCCK